MKRLFALLLAGAVALVPAGAAYAKKAKGVALAASAARTADLTGSYVSTNIRTNAILGDSDAYAGDFMVLFDVTAASGSAATPSVEGRLCSSCTAFTLTPTNGVAASAWTTISAVSQNYRIFKGPAPPEIRAKFDLDASAGDSYTFSVRAQIGE